MKINKYLEELGYTQNDMPEYYNRKCKNTSKAAADKRNRINKSGFCNREFFDLDHTFNLFIYPRLCYFRDNIADIATPGCFCEDPDGNNKWKETINAMCIAFKLDLEKDFPSEAEREIIQKGRQLFIEYYDYLWY